MKSREECFKDLKRKTREAISNDVTRELIIKNLINRKNNQVRKENNGSH